MYLQIALKVLPHGILNLIYEDPGNYGTLDSKVKVDPVTIEHAWTLYITSSHPVFNLVPPAFGVFIEECYEQMGCPSVTHENVWTLYHDVCSMIKEHMGVIAIL
ncbi:hypothetical protein PISMIDRAFT_21160 [Pisolithus microcarpus 441]|uniref:Uncharacterized protein n=1 Tax=Pisolithus microcarpus 441 TaxID=765257 RepID=A0A0C9YXU5_9AGAM|nr:hypothetical protein BKA83DRAFT_21160 [Pisolithus microcarpus]KIK29935.1 hypothetical protein PISMIDRAFT_21160 [Pisolithus microcarpus 441]